MDARDRHNGQRDKRTNERTDGRADEETYRISSSVRSSVRPSLRLSLTSVQVVLGMRLDTDLVARRVSKRLRYVACLRLLRSPTKQKTCVVQYSGQNNSIVDEPELFYVQPVALS